MDDLLPDLWPEPGAQPAEQVHQAISGAYVGQRNSYRLEIRIDVREQTPQALYRPLNLVSGDFYRDVGGGEWDYRYSFIVEHPSIKWDAEQVVIVGTMAFYRNMELTAAAQD
jgi:hypothetical protein